MRVRLAAWFVLAALAGCRSAAPVPAPPPAPLRAPVAACGTWPDGTVALPAALRDTIAARLARGRYVGLAVALLDSTGRSTYAFGTTAKGGAPVTPETRFEIGSVTKTVTGLLLAEAVERGAVSLDTPISALLPDTLRLRPEVARITLRQLTTHTSGLPRLPANLFGPGVTLNDPYAAYNAGRLYAGLRTASVDTAAQRLGTVAYSNLGAGLLGHLLARRADRSYSALVAGLGLFAEGWQTVPEPASADSVEFLDPQGAVSLVAPASSDRATGHTPTGQPTPPWRFTDALVGAGGIRASATSLGAYVAAQMAPGACASAAAVRRSHTLLARDGAGRDVAYGWFAQVQPDGRRVFWHNGGTGGFSSFVAFDPARRRGVVVLSNVSGSVDDLGALLLR